MTIVVASSNPTAASTGLTFLQLVQRLRRRCRVAGAGPATVLGTNSEEYARLIAWTNEAWIDIQETRQDWRWMRTSCSFTTVAGQATYSYATDIALTDFGNWTQDTWRNYDSSVGTKSEIFMEYRHYGDWRDAYQFGALRDTRSRPFVVTICPDMSIGIGPTPDAGYTVTGDYYRSPSELSLDADVPAIPTRFSMLIVYRAMMFYGMSEAANEVYQEGQIEFERMMRRLQLNQLTEIGGADPLC